MASHTPTRWSPVRWTLWRYRHVVFTLRCLHRLLFCCYSWRHFTFNVYLLQWYLPVHAGRCNCYHCIFCVLLMLSICLGNYCACFCCIFNVVYVFVFNVRYVFVVCDITVDIVNDIVCTIYTVLIGTASVVLYFMHTKMTFLSFQFDWNPGRSYSIVL